MIRPPFARARLIKTFMRDKKGNVALIFGLCAVPIIIATSIALDMSSASHMRSEVQAAADSAVLAAATRLAVGAGDSDKEALALETFYANLSPKLTELVVGTPDVHVNFPTKTVQMNVALTTESLISDLVADEIVLHIDAAATISPGTPICMMTLNDHAAQSLSIQGTADLIADGCSVQVNSDDEAAMHQNGSGTATATSFCVHGDYDGSNYSPDPRENCPAENDPLASEFASDWAAAHIDSTACTYSNWPQINSSSASTVTTILPGVYCGGLTIKKGTVQLQAGGMYVFRNGALEVQAHGTLKGTGVVVLFDGDNTTRLVTQAGASIITSARTSGLFQGIAFAQNPTSVPASPNLVIGGGTIEINGILYFPEQALKITGNGDIGTTASQFAIMADTIAIEGNGQLRIKIGQNYTSTGLPDLPAADEVVYLNE
jgi:Flp pilus assembly protein TadG